MFEKFTDGARHAVVYAQEEARTLLHPVVASEHLLLGVLCVDSSAADVLASAGIGLDAARRAVAAHRAAAKPRDLRGHMPFTPNAKRAMELAVRAAGAAPTDPVALLVGALDAHGGAVDVVRAVGADPASLRDAARAAISTTATESVLGDVRGMRMVPAKRRELRDEAGTAALLEQVVADRDRLRRALRRYARHDAGCAGADGCSCGLQGELDT
jgi:ATP-dependent Clp protease ATP-binding subunit ClpC